MSIKAYETSQEMREIIQADLPKGVIFKKPGKGDLDYISITFVMDLLNKTFGHFGWNVEIIDKWIQDSIPFFQKNDKYNTAPQDKTTTNEKGEKGQWLAQNPIAWVTVRLTVNVWDEEKNAQVTVVKEASGSKIINGKAGEQEHIFKSAQSDAIKKAAAMLGIGLELARKAPEKEFFEEINSEPLPIVWDEATQAQHQEEWNAVMNVLETNDWDVDTFAYYVEFVTNAQISDLYYLPVEKMPALIKLLKDEGLIAIEGEEE